MRPVPVIAACSVLLQACSLAVIENPPASDPGTRPVPCDTSRTAPALDVLGAAGSFVGMAAFMTAGAVATFEEGNDGAFGLGAGGSIAVGFGLLIPQTIYAVSAYRGFSRTGRCRKLNATAG